MSVSGGGGGMTEDDAKRAALDGDWEAVARYVVRRGLAREPQKCGACSDEAKFYEYECADCGKRVYHSRSDWQGPAPSYARSVTPSQWQPHPVYDWASGSSPMVELTMPWPSDDD
jgi:hypothetical protein